MKKTDLWIGGAWQPAQRYVPLVNPHTGERLAEVGYASATDVSFAIERAHDAFLRFRTLPTHQRARILYTVAQLIRDRREEMAMQIAVEAGKPMKASRAEVDRTVQTYLFASEAAKSLGGHTIPMDAAPRGERHIAFTQRSPIGVVSAITPFNFPMNLVAHKVGPAIAAGNSIVLKPAEQTPLSSLVLAELFQEAGLPDGVLNIVPGYGYELGETLVTHPLVQFVSFTGSPRVGKLLRQQAGLRRVTLELGSNSPLVVDAGFSSDELDRIAADTVSGAFSYNGQVCISIQRVWIHASAYETFVGHLLKHTHKLKTGDPMDETTDITALINEAAVRRLQSWLQEALDAGGEILTGGTFEGHVMAPTILANIHSEVSLQCEEAFGPILTLNQFESWDEAIQAANQSKYGLHAGVFTKDIEKAFRAANELQTGGVLINQVPTYRLDHMPYGGVKESGTGLEGVQYALEEMTQLKLTGLRLGVYDSTD